MSNPTSTEPDAVVTNRAPSTIPPESGQVWALGGVHVRVTHVLGRRLLVQTKAARKQPDSAWSYIVPVMRGYLRNHCLVTSGAR